MRRVFYILLIISIFTILYPVHNEAAPKNQVASPLGSDGSQPVTVTADSLDVDQKSHTATFTGKVEAVQGQMRLKSRVMRVYYKEQRKGQENAISRIDAEGNVILTSPKETAKGEKGIYDLDKKLLTLTGNVVLTQGKNVVRGEKLVYDVATGKSNLSRIGTGSQKSGGRVQGIFVPEGKDSK